MARRIKVKALHEIDFPAADVWQVLGGFDGLPAIATSTAGSKLLEDGRVRMLTNRDGGILWERLLQFDEAGKSLKYNIFDAKGCDAMLYGVGYEGTVRVRARRGGRAATFEYLAEFAPLNGASREEATAAIHAFASDCAAGVRRVLARARKSKH